MNMNVVKNAVKLKTDVVTNTVADTGSTRCGRATDSTRSLMA